jgi:hypothetical protein
MMCLCREIIDGFPSKLQYGFEQSHPLIANRELSRVYADGNSARACVTVVSRERALTPFIEFPRARQSEGMGRNGKPSAHVPPHGR